MILSIVGRQFQLARHERVIHQPQGRRDDLVVLECRLPLLVHGIRGDSPGTDHQLEPTSFHLTLTTSFNQHKPDRAITAALQPNSLVTSIKFGQVLG